MNRSLGYSVWLMGAKLHSVRCFQDSITHKIIEEPANEVAFQWTAPQNFTRPFRFHFTVARSKHTFWADETQDVEFRGADNFV